MSGIDWVAMILVVVGGLNWGLVAMNYNLVTSLVGSWPWLETTVYALVGLSAVWVLIGMFKGNKDCCAQM